MKSSRGEHQTNSTKALRSCRQESSKASEGTTRVKCWRTSKRLTKNFGPRGRRPPIRIMFGEGLPAPESMQNHFVHSQLVWLAGLKGILLGRSPPNEAQKGTTQKQHFCHVAITFSRRSCGLAARLPMTVSTSNTCGLAVATISRRAWAGSEACVGKQERTRWNSGNRSIRLRIIR